MLPLPYTRNKAFGILASHLREVESRLQPVARKRTVTQRGSKQLAAPQTETYLVPPKALSDGAQATARVLIQWQLATVEEARQVSWLSETATDAAPTPPPVATNNVALAKYRRVSSRTIISHLQEIEQAGIITARNFRGRHANYELWISTKFLWKTDSQAVSPLPAQNRTNTAQPVSPSVQSTNFHPFVVLEKQYKEEIINVSVDKLVTQPRQATLTGNTGPAQSGGPASNGPEPALEANEARNEIGEQGGAAGPAGVENPVEYAERLMLVEIFWSMARGKLYAGRQFSEHQVRLAKNAIWAGVYHGFRPDLTPQQWDQYHSQALERLEMARKYFHRHDGKFAPMPFAEFTAGNGYFDAANHNGFVGTLRWHEAQELSFHNRQVGQVIRLARKQFREHRLHTAAARVQEMSLIQLYRFHEKKARALGGPALREFYAQIAAPRRP